MNDPEDHDPWFSSEDNQVVEYSVEPQFRLANVFPSMPQSGQSNKIVECGEYSPFDMRCNALICVLSRYIEILSRSANALSVIRTSSTPPGRSIGSKPEAGFFARYCLPAFRLFPSLVD